ncbi:MAG: DEAD/DEAH box helicase family protein [Patescibacteria group bacterium]
MKKEARARIKINKLLEESGWKFFDDQKGKSNISLEPGVKVTQQKIDDLGNDFEKTEKGFIDYLLLEGSGFPVAVLEAKSEDKSPLDGKEQARQYAQSQHVRFVILSNGNLHYFWDLERGNPTIITSLPTAQSLKHKEAFKPSFKSLAEEKVPNDYIVLSQEPQYKQDPRWLNEETRNEYTKENDFKFLRDYQLSAVHSLQDSAKDEKDRYLFEMATGTGKTLVSAAVIKLFLKTGNAKRILFLVDRLELEDQAYKNFKKWLHNDYNCVIYKENKDDWKKAEIVVSTVQSLLSGNKYMNSFSPTDFELVISDEAHRSISGNSRAVFEYFVGYKLGLTATPKDYLKNINLEKINQKDPRAWEKRQLLDTYKTFGCETGSPTFRYSLLDGVKDGFLVNPIVIDARTEITTELLSESGYSIMVENDEGVEEEKAFFQKDFERKFFSEKTNTIFCKTFLDKAIKDPITSEIGKSLIFCVSQGHASKISQILNQLADQMFPGKYNSDFAVQITSNISSAQQFTTQFDDKSNNLNGRTKWIDGYKSSKTRVCATVGMMTTGYDCQDILNIGLMRPIFSPTDFIQIKGRGTRKYTFSFTNEGQKYKFEKENFKLFDFFANCEYFEEKFNYDEILKLPIFPKGGGSPKEPPGTIDEIKISIPDPLKSLQERAIGLEGMKVDRKLFERFEAAVKDDGYVKEKVENGDFQAAEDYVKTKLFDKPEDYISLDKLRKSIRLDRRLTLRELLEKIFGKLDKFKSKDELLEDEFNKFVSIYKPDPKYYYPIKNFLKAYITDDEIRQIVDSKEYGRFTTNPKVNMQDYKSLEEYRNIIPDYVKDYVALNTYMN